MHKLITGAALVAAIMVGLTGCTQVGEPWDDTDYFEQERTHFEGLQEQLRHRAMQTQRGA